MAKDFQYAGSVSSGTMRDQDLIPRFLDVLKNLSQARWSKFIEDHNITVVEEEGSVDWELTVDEEPELASVLTSDLFEVLEELAPAGYYFGASEGDGADYGFWEDPDYEPIADDETQYETYDGDELA